MISFKSWLVKKENYGGSANFPSGVEDEGDGGDALANRIEKPGAFPTYGDDLPITKKNRSNKSTNDDVVSDKEEKPFAVFVLASVDGGYAATTRPTDRGEFGKIGLPGGKVDPGEDPVSAAEREALEEGWSLEINNDVPFYKQFVDGKMVWWYRGFNARKIISYKEKGRIEPIVATKDQVINSGYGNENLGI